jgi:hypothetical protein
MAAAGYSFSGKTFSALLYSHCMKKAFADDMDFDGDLDQVRVEVNEALAGAGVIVDDAHIIEMIKLASGLESVGIAAPAPSMPTRPTAGVVAPTQNSGSYMDIALKIGAKDRAAGMDPTKRWINVRTGKSIVGKLAGKKDDERWLVSTTTFWPGTSEPFRVVLQPGLTPARIAEVEALSLIHI